MDKKFELTNENIDCCGTKIYRIKALKDFGIIKAGDLGGFVERESNLSQEGNCWIYNNANVRGDAVVCDNAGIYDNATVCDKAKVYGNAIICDHAIIYNNAIVCDDAIVNGNARAFDKAVIYNNAIVGDNTMICGNARIYDKAAVYGSAIVCDNAKVHDNAVVCDSAEVFDNAEVNRQMKIFDGTFTKNTFEESIRCQTGLLPFNGKVIAYKQVNKDLTSLFDKNFQYAVGEWAEVKEPDMSDSGCTSGLHFSNPNYWNRNADIRNTTILIAEIDLNDIITVQRGKIRCKRAFILGTYNV